ncbi:hypothetical protein SB8_15930 [Pseudomonas oryzihabitans]|nr:hypothetical protein SB8_15930 [Pseudomonas psychrotolerans]
MNAEPDDAPDWLVHKRSKARPLGIVTCLVIGSLVTVGALELASKALPKHRVTETTAQPNPSVEVLDPHSPSSMPASIGMVTRTPPMPAEPALAAATAARLEDPRPAITYGRQTVFNDQNFTPRGADNVLRLSQPTQALTPPEAPPQRMKVTIVRQTPSMKDRACWPFKSGSLEQRNCRSSVGLNYRD